MERIKKHIVNYFTDETSLVSLAAIENPYPYNPLIDGLDLLILAIFDNECCENANEHVQFEGERILIRTMDRNSFVAWIASGENRNIMEWIVRGEILLDREGYLSNVRESLLQFPHALREQKRIVEFSGFLRTYLQAKQDLLDGNLLDAYSHVLTSLHHWAHIVLIEEGRHPELTVWKQMRLVHPGVYKLYEELTASPETLEQRVQLVMLACEFTVMNKMKSSCSLLLSILAGREEPWSVAELQNHPSIQVLHLDLSLLLQKLVKRAYVSEVAVIKENTEPGILELRYRVSEQIA